MKVNDKDRIIDHWNKCTNHNFNDIHNRDGIEDFIKLNTNYMYHFCIFLRNFKTYS